MKNFLSCLNKVFLLSVLLNPSIIFPFTEVNQAYFSGLLLQSSDGYSVAAGVGFINNVPNGLIARYDTDGILDEANFGTGGYTFDLGGADALQYFGIGIQSDNSLIVAGYAVVDGLSQIAVGRYGTDGILDDSYGNTSGLEIILPVSMDGAQAASVAVQSSNDYAVIAGNASVSGVTNALVARFLILTVIWIPHLIPLVMWPRKSEERKSIANAIAIQGDGKFVVGGWAIISGVVQFALWRFNTDGSPDTGFNGTGYATMSIGSTSSIAAIGIDNDGNIVAAGT